MILSENTNEIREIENDIDFKENLFQAQVEMENDICENEIKENLPANQQLNPNIQLLKHLSDPTQIQPQPDLEKDICEEIKEV